MAKNGVASALFIDGQHVGEVPKLRESGIRWSFSSVQARSEGDDKPRIAIELEGRKVKITNYRPALIPQKDGGKALASVHTQELKLGRKPELWCHMLQPYELGPEDINDPKLAKHVANGKLPTVGFYKGGYPAVTDNLHEGEIANALREIGSDIYRPFSESQQQRLHNALATVGIEIPLPGAERTVAIEPVALPGR